MVSDSLLPLLLNLIAGHAVVAAGGQLEDQVFRNFLSILA